MPEPDPQLRPADLTEVSAIDDAPPAGKRRKRNRSLVREIIELALIVILVFAGTRLFFLPYQVDGASMSPYLANGERLFVNRTAYAHVDLNDLIDLIPGQNHDESDEFYPFHAPQRGDVIVLTPPVASSEPYVKRIIGLPGETITFAYGFVFVDGMQLDEPYIDGPITTCNSKWCTVTVPPDSVFVLGDNRTNSSDSRVFGPVRESDIIGKAIFSNWPLDKIGPIRHPDYGE